MGMESGFAAGLPSLKKGIDLAQIPAKPGLQTGLSVQCCAKSGASCSCPKCKAKAEAEEESGDSNVGHSSADASTATVSETVSRPEGVSQNADTSADTESAGDAAEAPARTLLVEGPSAELQEGQMTKMDFLQQLRESICGAIGPVLATAGQTTDGCPYLNYWLDLYEQKTAAEVEQTVHRYAPGSANATNASAYISIVTARALRAAQVWARTGRLTEIPEGVPTDIPGEPPAEESASNAAPVMTKAKEGGPKNTDDPAAIQEQLGAGSALSSSVRSRMESAFGTSFSDVKTHTDSNAASVSNRVNARAFTVGNHVAFGSGEYQPGTMIGDALIAHELAHVMQQRNTSGSVNKMEVGGSSYESLETDADVAAAGAVSSLWGMNGLTQKAMPALRSGLRLQGCRTVNQRANTCTSRTTPASPSKTVTVRPTYLFGGNTASQFTTQLAKANTVYAIAGITVAAGNALTINETDTKAMLGTTPTLHDSPDPPRAGSYTSEETALFSHNTASNEISAYYLQDLETNTNLWALSYVDSGYLIQSNRTTDRVLAHEMGHLLMGLGHPTSNNDNIMAQSSIASGVDCLSDEQIDSARASNLAR